MLECTLINFVGSRMLETIWLKTSVVHFTSSYNNISNNHFIGYSGGLIPGVIRCSKSGVK